MSQGVLIAADRHCEWLLPWFFERYTACNSYSLAVVDLGMSHGAVTFCRDRAEVIPLQMDRIPPLSIQKQGWYKKPFAFLQTPFDQTLWLDCDCEVLRPLDPLFQLEGEMHLAFDTENSHLKEIALGTIREGEVLYNSGVVLYRKGSSIIKKWADQVLDQDRAFFSDQHVLSKLIQESKSRVGLLPDLYNWRMSQGFNIHAAIIHWAGSWGKEYIRKQGGIAHELAALPSID